MEFDELLITTGVDALVRLVKDKQRIELEDAAYTLNIPPETIEDWARVLEEEGILRIEYRLTRIYLVWIKPTEEEIATEAKSFYEEKRTVEEEIGEFKRRVSDETKDIKELQATFAQFYSKAYKRISKLEKAVSSLPAAKAVTGEAFSEYQQELEGMGSELLEVKEAVGKIDSEFKDLGIEKAAAESKELVEKTDKIAEELGSLHVEMEELRKRAEKGVPSGVTLPSINEIKKKFESIKKDFTALRTKNAKMREDMISLQESSEILKNVAESIMGHEGQIEGLGKEMAVLSAEADKLMEKSKAVSERVKQHVELMERLGESATVAKGILKRFPSQKKVMEELERIKKSEGAVLEKNKSLEKILGAVGGRQLSAKQFSELAKKMESKAEQMRRELDSLEAVLEDEKGTYLTFQKIKERVGPAIKSHYRRLGEMEKRIDTIRKETLEEKKRLKAGVLEAKEALKGGETKELLRVAQEIEIRKNTLEGIRGSVEELVTLTDNLNKRITLLSREAKLLEIRAGEKVPPPPSGKGKEKRAGIRHTLRLSQEEEMEFRRKREELKKLVQKLWEE
jgi:chromosome segregation ATPase